MLVEATLIEPEEFMGLIGPLVTIYQILLWRFEHEIMSDSDWERAEALAELEGFCPGAENMFQRIQAVRLGCLHDIEALLTHPLRSDDIMTIKPTSHHP